MPILKLENISKSFGGVSVIKNVSLELSKGEFFSIVGPSGCGKTTLLRIIAGLEDPDSGKVFINDINATGFTPQKRNTGIVFQNYALFPNMSVFDNVAYGLEVRKSSKDLIRKKVMDILDKVRMTDKARKNVTLLSGGEQQRVSLARVIVTEPSLLLFDEPLSNLDYALRLETRNEIKRLQRDIGITSVYVTHDQSEALALSDRIAVMNRGIVMQTGTPRQIYSHPDNIFTADFIGHTNFFDKKTSYDVFGMTISDEEVLAVFPEDILIEKCRDDCNGIITDIQFTGYLAEYMIEINSGSGIKLIKAVSPADVHNVTVNEKVKITFNRSVKLNKDK